MSQPGNEALGFSGFRATFTLLLISSLLVTSAVCAPQRRQASGVEPSGELRERIRLTQNRLTKPGVPEYTPEFLLADVMLDPGYPRRFSNYSGDTSGRYIGALSLLPAEGPARVRDLVARLIKYQREDGRFGNNSLRFTADEIGPEHMALLWGNGRLLLGLMEYYSVHREKPVLESARRLGDFLVDVRRVCSAPQVRQRLEGQGAMGFICFTQLIEALVPLWRETGDARYLETAKEIAPLLQPRGIQHSHGYLTTLRGIVMLYEATKDAAFLKYVEDAYRDLVSSSDYTVFGGVPEYFGMLDEKLPEETRRQVLQSSGMDPRDEGCSEADFLRLSLQLWRVTGEISYLERAEKCLLNEFYHNQFSTGDFGHRVISSQGFKPKDNIARAWWCCTMHGLRALRDVLDSMVTGGGPVTRINLFLDGSYHGKDLALSLSGVPGKFSIRVDRATGTRKAIAIRVPEWSEKQSILINGRKVKSEAVDGYIAIDRAWKKSDRVEVSFDCRVRLQTREGRMMNLKDAGDKPVEAALWYGPWLLGADDGQEPLFFGEPWQENVLLVGDRVSPVVRTNGSFGVPAHIRLEYVHGGFPGRHVVELRPISEQTSRIQDGTVAVWLRYRRSKQNLLSQNE